MKLNFILFILIVNYKMNGGKNRNKSKLHEYLYNKIFYLQEKRKIGEKIDKIMIQKKKKRQIMNTSKIQAQ